MSEIVNKIKYAMSLRTPQEEALSYLDAISSHCDYKKDSKDVVEAAASEYCEKQRKVKAGFDFPSFCFAMATGIGKTRLMGACIYHLYKTKGYKHFFILAPGNTIYDKLRKESNPNHPKYIFKGLEAEMGRPKVYDGENYDTYPVKFEQMSLRIEKTSEIQLFIFNIGKIFNSKTDTQFNFHKFKETLGASFADVLAQFDDLVICMDEAHRYNAPASMKAINYLKPVLGLEFTATPKTTSNVIYAYDLARGAVEGYLKIPVVMGRSNMAGYNQDDIEEMKIRDGLTLHEYRKAVLREYCSDNDLDYVKPIVLIACKDTDHAKKIRALIDSDDFQKGKYKGKVIEIHYQSNKKHFKAEEDALPRYLQKYFSRIIRVTRLREVRVLLGFTRVDAPDPDADEQPNVVALSKGKQERWLPAAEVNGEGIFIEFNKDTLAAWLNSPAVKGLSEKYSDSYREFCESKGWTITVVRNAVYVLMHTFAHLMIKQMSMSSGYSSSAIRERIYFGDKMAGILLYTGSSDKEGSLGGLVELGNIDQMTNLMRDAFQEALVCTNDPECMSNLPAGKNSNGAACHSCCMISETACENGNRMLDRGLAVPIPGREECSYFKELVGDLCQVEI